jgi:bacteriorhodopsin
VGAALTAATIAALVVALLGFAAVVVFPRSLDGVRAIMLPGTSHADLQAEQDIGASDTYWGVLMLATMLAAVLLVALRPPRARAGSGLLALLALPPALFGVALAGSGQESAAVAFAAAVLTLAAAAVIAPARPAPSEELG